MALARPTMTFKGNTPDAPTTSPAASVRRSTACPMASVASTHDSVLAINTTISLTIGGLTVATNVGEEAPEPTMAVVAVMEDAGSDETTLTPEVASDITGASATAVVGMDFSISIFLALNLLISGLISLMPVLMAGKKINTKAPSSNTMPASTAGLEI